MNKSFWKDKSVLVTGHTGFKGGWLSLWLNSLGAKVHGYSLAPESSQIFYESVGIKNLMTSEKIDDIRNFSSLNDYIGKIKPDIVFHLAAQSLVRPSYKEPIETFNTNVMGTVHLLEAALKSTPNVVVNVTSDKCYENKERLEPYKEFEAMGGYDPYSASKGCAEIVTSSYRRSFYRSLGKQLASARAGNVIGGGDRSLDRLIPDFFRAAEKKESLLIRSPLAVRPWQHVLEPLHGYMLLAEKLYHTKVGYDEAWNFGPSPADTKTVKWVIELLCKLIPEANWHSIEGQAQLHEATLLSLDSSKAIEELGWKPRWSVETALKRTVEWNEALNQAFNMREVSLKQINLYEQ